MRRLQLFQFKDQTWLPGAWRDALEFFHAAQHRLVKSPRAFASVVDRVCMEAGTTSIVDLESGSGGAFLSMLRQLRAQAPRPWHCVMTDHAPDGRTAAKISKRGADELRYESAPVDATRVPEALTGVRTFVSSFRDLHPLAARAALRDAFDKRQPVLVLELTKNSVLSLATVLVFPALFWLMLPFLRPRRLSQLFFVYLCPILPAMAFWDALVANRRTYSRAQYQQMTADLKADDYRWQVQGLKVLGVPYEVDCLVGTPVATMQVNGAA
jgi:hypothetical protein